MDTKIHSVAMVTLILLISEGLGSSLDREMGNWDRERAPDQGWDHRIHTEVPSHLKPSPEPVHPTADNTLKCFECIPVGSENCTETQRNKTSCPAHTKCAAVTFRSYAGETKGEKTCVEDVTCMNGSANLGFRLVSSCCSTDLCNDRYPTPPVNPNGKKCYTCKDNDCSNILQCTGDQDRCISTNAVIKGEAMKTAKGCASKSICQVDWATIPGIADFNNIQCCEDDLCNGAPRSTGATSSAVSLLFLVAPVVSVVLFN